MPSLKEMQDLRREKIAAASESAAATTPAGARLLTEAVEKTAQAIREWSESCKRKRGLKPTALAWLDEMPPEVAALLVGRVTIDAFGLAKGSARYTTLCLRIGTYVCEESEIRRRVRKDKALRGHVKKIAQSGRSRQRKKELAKTRTAIQKDYVSRVERVVVGAQLLQLFIEATGLASTEIRSRYTAAGPRSYKVVVPMAGLSEWIADYNEQSALWRPLFMPLSQEPIPWSSAKGGGYGPEAGSGGVLIIRGSAAQEAAVKPGAAFLKAINALQATPWSINEDVFEVFKTMWSSRAVQAGLPPREPLEVPPEPTQLPDFAPERRAWRRAAVRILTAEQERRGRVIAFGRTAWLASRLASDKRFWFPMFCDFRGRAYPRSSFVQPQGSDLAKGLQLFADGAPIRTERDADWLRIHLANCFGVDKVSFADRLLWVSQHDRQLREVGDDPLENRWWTEADNPWCFLAACLDYWRFRQEGFGYVSRVPVALDGSNNGLQLYALLTGSADLARRTNVLPCAAPQDVYAEVAAAATLRLQELADEPGPVGVGVGFLLREVFGGKLPRQAVKRSVMTLPYGVTEYASGRYVTETIKEWCDKTGKQLPTGLDHYAVLSAVSGAVWREIRSGVKPALDCMDWIRKLATDLSAAGKPLQWTAPSGFFVEQRYEKSKWRAIKTILGDKVRVHAKIKMRGPTGELSAKEAANGAPPNFVHSLDAAVMCGTVNRCADVGIRQFAAVHDSFAVPAADATFLAQAIRESAVDVFRSSPLDSLAESVEASLGSPVERFPRLNEFDPAEVLGSKYFFA